MVTNRAQTLKGKKILITAGPTWVAIDPVRVLSNIATGETGQILARLAKEKGAQVKLLLSSASGKVKIKGVKIRHFRYFNQLRSLINREIKENRFDCIIHNAAVSDFLIKRRSGKKIASNRNLKLEFYPAPKIIEDIRKKNRCALLVMFKLEVNASLNKLVKKARIAQRQARADIVVANTYKSARLKSYIYNHKSLLAKAEGRNLLARKLISILEKKL